MLEKCFAIEKPIEACCESHLPIEAIAELGFPDEALKSANKILKLLPQNEIYEYGRMSETAATICLLKTDEEGAERFLDSAMSRAELAKGSLAESVTESIRFFKLLHGLIDPNAECSNQYQLDEEEQIEAAFNHALRLFNKTVEPSKGKRKSAAIVKAAKVHLKKMEQATKLTDDPLQIDINYQWLVRCFAEIGDEKSTKKYFRKLDVETQADVLDPATLAKFGLQTVVIKSAKAMFAGARKELKTSVDPNVHIPMDAIQTAVSVLNTLNSQDTARKLLTTTVQEIPKWSNFQHGTFAVAAFRSLAEASFKSGLQDLGEEFLVRAEEDVLLVEHKPDRKAAVAANLALRAEYGSLEDALGSAKKLRSKVQRRLEVAKLLAKAGRFKNLREHLVEVESPKEGANICWWVGLESSE